MIFRLNPRAGQPLYLQLMQQIRHAVETGLLKPGEQLPGIRTLALELVVSHTTVVKAYAELENEGLVDVRHGSGVYIAAKTGRRIRTESLRVAQERVNELVDDLRSRRLSAEEIRRLFEAALLYPERAATPR